MGNERIILLLLSENATFVTPSNNQMDCLTIAVYRKHNRVVNMIISRIENPNYVSRYGTALHIAAQNDDVEIIKILLQHPSVDIYAKFKG
jgi:serum/glucocorticoid-regulated kinase 2